MLFHTVPTKFIAINSSPDQQEEVAGIVFASEDRQECIDWANTQLREFCDKHGVYFGGGVEDDCHHIWVQEYSGAMEVLFSTSDREAFAVPEGQAEYGEPLFEIPDNITLNKVIEIRV